MVIHLRQMKNIDDSRFNEICKYTKSFFGAGQICGRTGKYRYDLCNCYCEDHFGKQFNREVIQAVLIYFAVAVLVILLSILV